MGRQDLLTAHLNVCLSNLVLSLRYSKSRALGGTGRQLIHFLQQLPTADNNWASLHSTGYLTVKTQQEWLVECCSDREFVTNSRTHRLLCSYTFSLLPLMNSALEKTLERSMCGRVLTDRATLVKEKMVPNKSNILLHVGVHLSAYVQSVSCSQNCFLWRVLH